MSASSGNESDWWPHQIVPLTDALHIPVAQRDSCKPAGAPKGLRRSTPFPFQSFSCVLNIVGQQEIRNYQHTSCCCEISRDGEGGVLHATSSSPPSHHFGNFAFEFITSASVSETQQVQVQEQLRQALCEHPNGFGLWAPAIPEKAVPSRFSYANSRIHKVEGAI